jgi:8-amino-7-oxononanoate synthase
MSRVFARHEAKLQLIDAKGRTRSLSRRRGIDFTSNDYLGLAGSQHLETAARAALDRGVPVGAGGSRLLRGNHSEHEALEAEAAEFFRADRALYFGSGYAANVSILSTLPLRDDIVVHDSLIHASAHDGIAAGKAIGVAAPHNDVDAFDDAIRKWRRGGGRGLPWLVVESLYSMDGDRAPLRELADVADRWGGFLVIDEAHATGVYGDGGRGLAEDLHGRENIVTINTCGKALGVEGALVCANRIVLGYLLNRARPFIYSTAPSPLAAACVRAALEVLKDEPERRAMLMKQIALANRLMVSYEGFASSGSQILPLILGDDARAVRVADEMQADGFDIRAIRPPTVPARTARLRITVTLNVDHLDITAMLERLARVVAAEKL